MTSKERFRNSFFIKDTKLLKSQEEVLNQSNGESARRQLEQMALENQQEWNEIWDDIILHNEPGDIRNFFHLDYICSEKVRYHDRILQNKKICLIAHVNYTDLICHCFEYLKRVPDYIDIFITTKGDTNINLIEKQIKKTGRKNIRIIVPRDRGREISALLVACKEFLMEYEYLCFVHDKKKNKGEPYQTVGQSFMDILWENSIKNEIYIENIISQFEKEPRLGLLSPPAPYMSNFFTVGAVSWTGCYKKTAELAKRLNLNCIMEENKHPFILGTTFWCRTAAMRPLFEGGVEYEDFDPEPMALDDTISHAIERILPFVAQSEGYYSGIMMNHEYASLYVSNYCHMLSKVVDKYIKDENWNKYADIPKKDERLKLTCRLYKAVWIYGAGKVGENCYNLLKEEGIDKVKGFIVSAGHKKEEFFLNKKIYEIDEIETKDDELIILALNRANRQEVMPMLLKHGFKNIERFW